MQQSSELSDRSASQTLYQRIETKLGVDPLSSPHPCSRGIGLRLPRMTLSASSPL